MDVWSSVIGLLLIWSSVIGLLLIRSSVIGHSRWVGLTVVQGQLSQASGSVFSPEARHQGSAPGRSESVPMTSRGPGRTGCCGGGVCLQDGMGMRCLGDHCPGRDML